MRRNAVGSPGLSAPHLPPPCPLRTFPRPSFHTWHLSGSVPLSFGNPVQTSPLAGEPSNAVSVMPGVFPPGSWSRSAGISELPTLVSRVCPVFRV